MSSTEPDDSRQVTAPDPGSTRPEGVTADRTAGLSSGAFRGAVVSEDATQFADHSPPPVPGTVSVPGYAIESVLGRGGMGVVYKARHLALKRTVALKMILAGGHAGERELTRFRIEAEAVARLQHPNIVQIHEVGTADGHPYCALEFVEGGDLAGRLGDGPMPSREAAKLVGTLARAMQLAHSRNVVHRDLKPANILVTADGTPKITDFGLARQTDTDSGETLAGTVMGTPSYMAPEQASGRANEAGPAADIYALGAILYACLTGRPPFQGKTVLETLDQVRTREPMPPSRLQSRVPLDLETICLKCLRKEPEHRYASAAELADELVRYRNGEPILARPVGRLERGWRWCKRNPVVAVLSSGLVLALLAGVIVSASFAFQAAKEADEARTARNLADDRAREAIEAQQLADRNAARARSNERLAFDRAYNSDLRLFQQMWERKQFDAARELLDRQRPEVTDGVERRGFEWDYWNRQGNLRLLTLARQTGPVSCVAFSPDGKGLATGGQGDYVKRTWSVKLWDAVTGRELHSLSGNGRRVTGVAFSPDGKRLVSVSDELVARVWDVATGQPLFTLEGHTQYIRAVACSRDGRHIATGSGDSTVRLWDAHTGKERLVLTDANLHPINSLAFSPDGTRLVAAGEGDYALRVWDIATGKKLLTLPGHRGPVLALAFSPDGKRMASGGQGGSVIIWDEGGGNRSTLEVSTGYVYGVVFTADSRRLVTVSDRDGPKLWDVATGLPLFTFRGHRGVVTGLALGPDGNRLASSDGDGVVEVWDGTAAEAATILTPTGNVQTLAIGSDGRQLIGGMQDGQVRVWDARTGDELRTFGTPPALMRAIAVHPEGHQVVTSGTGLVLEVWDPRAGKRLHAERSAGGDVQAAAYHPDGTCFATAGFDGVVRIRSSTDFKPGRTFPCSGQPFALAYDRDGRHLALRDAQGVKVWDTATGRLTADLPDGTNFVGPVAFSPDGRLLAAGNHLGIVTIWDRIAARPVRRLTGHTGWISGLAYSPDGKRLASSGSDRSVKVWDPAAGEELLTLTWGLVPFHCVVFSPCGKFLFAGADGGIRKWEGIR